MLGTPASEKRCHAESGCFEDLTISTPTEVVEGKQKKDARWHKAKK
jgi:hypothetical protein